jgi:hypothetical protein
LRINFKSNNQYLIIQYGLSLDYFKSIIIMRGNSLGLKKPVFRPLIIEKSNIPTRPTTRGTSFQSRPIRGTTKNK